MMKFAEEAADSLELSGELRAAFIKEAEETFNFIMEHSKTAALSDQIAKGVQEGLKKQKQQQHSSRNRILDAMIVASVGVPMIAGLSSGLFAKRQERKRFKGMVAEAGQRGYTEITEATDPEEIEGAFHIVNAYSPTLASHPLLAVNATRHVLETAMRGTGGLDPTSIPQLVAAEDALSGQKKPVLGTLQEMKVVGDSVANLADSFAS